MALHIPVIETERLRLVPLSSTFSDAMFELWSNADVCRYSGTVKDYDGNEIDMPAKSKSDSDKIIDFWQKAVRDEWGFRWAILFETNHFTGTIGFNSLGACSEIAFHLLPAFWRQGIAYEASCAAIAWRKENGGNEIDAFIEPENSSSVVLANRLNMHATQEFSDGAQRYRLMI